MYGSCKLFPILHNLQHWWTVWACCSLKTQGHARLFCSVLNRQINNNTISCSSIIQYKCLIIFLQFVFYIPYSLLHREEWKANREQEEWSTKANKHSIKGKAKTNYKTIVYAKKKQIGEHSWTERYHLWLSFPQPSYTTFFSPNKITAFCPLYYTLLIYYVIYTFLYLSLTYDSSKTKIFFRLLN